MGGKAPSWNALQDDVERIRKIHIVKGPKWRLDIATKALRDPDIAARQLVAHVSAIEGLARSLLMHEHHENSRDLLKAYRAKYWKLKPQRLIKLYLECKSLPKPAAYFGEDVWERFKIAVNYRNLIVHECTYHDIGKSKWTIASCEHIFERLVDFAQSSEACSTT